MKAAEAQSIRIETGPDEAVSALLIQPPQSRACYVFAHGAGAGMTHASMETVAAGLAERDIATLRYQFPYMEKGSKRPDPPAVAHAAVRAAVAEAARCCEGLPLFAGGRSFGGRMTSQAQALAPLAGVRGLAFLGFPLHPAGRPAGIDLRTDVGCNSCRIDGRKLRRFVAVVRQRARLDQLEHPDRIRSDRLRKSHSLIGQPWVRGHAEVTGPVVSGRGWCCWQADGGQVTV
jgi:hypothetical protein